MIHMTSKVGRVYVKRIIGDNLTHRLLRIIFVLVAPCRSTEDAENKFRGLICTSGNKVRKL